MIALLSFIFTYGIYSHHKYCLNIKQMFFHWVISVYLSVSLHLISDLVDVMEWLELWPLSWIPVIRTESCNWLTPGDSCSWIILMFSWLNLFEYLWQKWCVLKQTAIKADHLTSLINCRPLSIISPLNQIPNFIYRINWVNIVEKTGAVLLYLCLLSLLVVVLTYHNVFNSKRRVVVLGVVETFMSRKKMDGCLFDNVQKKYAHRKLFSSKSFSVDVTEMSKLAVNVLKTESTLHILSVLYQALPSGPAAFFVHFAGNARLTWCSCEVSVWDVVNNRGREVSVCVVGNSEQAHELLCFSASKKFTPTV